MKCVIYTLSDGIESRPISNKNQKLVSFKKGHSRIKGILMVSAEVYTSLLSRMNVNKS